ncbi:DUF2797 domain-containing protein [Tamilnaduibacter salinus]|uniref:DUF2797 domain-containing protein n=1 Tax=Tamilnaduibacter salinus TaxID=1484056 RepID=UPI001B801EDA|nr:DUF2797 domain-containing protein [Tamilnaduibacter salinus]
MTEAPVSDAAISPVVDVEGRLNKMPVSADSPVQYQLLVGDTRLPLNDLLGREIAVDFTGEIRCIHCDRKTRKSFNQGYCYPCFRRLARCDSCIKSPEKCHYHLGTCREPEWGEQHCMVPHVVYLANSSGVKVGITRGSQVPTRWIDQGAVEAVPMLEVATRRLAGLAEVVCKAHVADRTNWRTMLKGDVPPVDLYEERRQLLAVVRDELEQLRDEHGHDAIREAHDGSTALAYPVSSWPETVRPLNLDRTPSVRGRLDGIKGQYLILDSGVLNIRKFTAYQVRVRVYDEPALTADLFD